MTDVQRLTPGPHPEETELDRVGMYLDSTGAFVTYADFTRLQEQNRRLHEENAQLRLLLKETRSAGFPRVPIWFDKLVTAVLKEGGHDDK